LAQGEQGDEQTVDLECDPEDRCGASGAADGQQPTAVGINTAVGGSWWIARAFSPNARVHLGLSDDPSRSLTMRCTGWQRLVGSDTEEVTGSNPVAPTSTNGILHSPTAAACQRFAKKPLSVVDPTLPGSAQLKVTEQHKILELYTGFLAFAPTEPERREVGYGRVHGQSTRRRAVR
jgi:hypothetical protein